jgi:hypothetical protein
MRPRAILTSDAHKTPPNAAKSETRRERYARSETVLAAIRPKTTL